MLSELHASFSTSSDQNIAAPRYSTSTENANLSLELGLSGNEQNQIQTTPFMANEHLRIPLSTPWKHVDALELQVRVAVVSTSRGRGGGAQARPPKDRGDT